MKPALLFASGLWLAVACDSPSPPASGSDSAGKAAAEAIHKPIDQSRDAEKQIFDAADRQKQQADAL